MIPGVKRFAAVREFLTPERCFIVETSNSGDDPDVSIARARVRAGETTRWHRLHATAERYVILEGAGRVEVGGLDAQTVGIGDAVLIPPMCRQRITSIGPEDLVFLAICSPRYRDANYEDLGDGDAGPAPGSPHVPANLA
jgi:mannose-6-phosphate isomerase-like protein (cupin superfamily)